MLNATGIAKRYGAVTVLEDVHLHLRAGEVHALMGQNGAGKSTLIKILTGVIAPNAGTLALAGQPIAPESPLASQRLGISTVYQEVNLCPNLTVAENIFAGRYPRRGVDPREIRGKVKAGPGVEGGDGAARGHLGPLEKLPVVDPGVPRRVAGERLDGMAQHRPVSRGGEVRKLPVEALLDRRHVPRVRRTASACVKAPLRQLRQRRGERDAGASSPGLLGGSKDAPPRCLQAGAVRWQADEDKRVIARREQRLRRERGIERLVQQRDLTAAGGGDGDRAVDA